MNKYLAASLAIAFVAFASMFQLVHAQGLVVGTQIIYGADKNIRDDGKSTNGDIPDFVRYSAGSNEGRDLPLLRVRADGSLMFNFSATVHFSKQTFINVAGSQMGYVMVWVGNQLALLPVFRPLHEEGRIYRSTVTDEEGDSR